MPKPNAYLAKMRLEREAYAYATKEHAVDIAMKLALVAMNDVFGVGRERAIKFWQHYNELNREFHKMKQSDLQYAEDKLNLRVKQIIGEDTQIEVEVSV